MSRDKGVKERPKFMRRQSVMIGVLIFLAGCVVVIANARAPQRRAQPRRVVRKPAVQPPRINYSEFSHVTHVTNNKLACASCHTFPTKNWKDVRTGDAAFPDVAEFPEHSACINCHRKQFFARERPAPAICSNCHVNATPRDTQRFLFPALGDVNDSKLKTREFVSEFRAGFPHEKHVDVVGAVHRQSGTQFINAAWRGPQQTEQSKSCAVCHQTYQPQGKSSEEYVTKPLVNLGDNFWLKKGTFQTAPNSHTTCFTCHAPDGVPPEPKDCHLCHALAKPEGLKVDFDPQLASAMGITDKTLLDSWSTRISAGAYRHEGGMHPDVGCTTCHNFNTMNTVEPLTLKVPVRSCGGSEGCHITATADEGGALNFEMDQKKTNAAFVCSKCHISFGKEAIPATHAAAIPAAKK